MKRVAQFSKVSYEEFKASITKSLPELAEGEILSIYNDIILPKRATKGSAGYDFFSPFDFTLFPGASFKIPTGIRAEMNESWVLKIFPRSGLGFKYRLRLDNTVGIIDSDYFYSDNEGHIMIKITNETNENKTIRINKQDAFAQGIFVEYGITIDDDTEGIRNGGFGSTSEKA